MKKPSTLSTNIVEADIRVGLRFDTQSTTIEVGTTIAVGTPNMIAGPHLEVTSVEGSSEWLATWKFEESPHNDQTFKLKQLEIDLGKFTRQIEVQAHTRQNGESPKDG